ncbi:Nucleic-acid-binding protein transposon like protein [Argiope bruennichi]|uniref:Nucleic-acid-binding protein transposon like protein n=1 Tax=Argiope bruennichi TaxID=94029 RepID=A0A8T0F380_ARGBR|nr:Nucleic-acid-binding protein transposon like protein [Argiope bruennichi]
MEGPKDLEMMEESDEDIPSEFSPEVREILRTDKRLQARIDEFLNQIDLTIEKYINKQNHQCFNCQLWNHGSKGCKLKPKCVICAESHISRDCPKKGKETEVKCANCGGPHTANYRGCPKYPKVAQHKSTQPGTSYVDAIKTKTHPQPDRKGETTAPPPRQETGTKNVNKKMTDEESTKENLQEVLTLAAELNKIFSAIKDIPGTIAAMQQKENVWEKLMILAEALRSPTASN